VDAHYESSANRVVIEFRYGQSIGIPVTSIPEVRGATACQLAGVEVTDDAIRWNDLDVDISVPGLLSDWLGPRFSTAAAGRIGGKSKSRAKGAAARANGKKGGRPRS
jgi:hypothetical protein